MVVISCSVPELATSNYSIMGFEVFPDFSYSSWFIKISLILSDFFLISIVHPDFSWFFLMFFWFFLHSMLIIFKDSASSRIKIELKDHLKFSNLYCFYLKNENFWWRFVVDIKSFFCIFDGKLEFFCNQPYILNVDLDPCFGHGHECIKRSGSVVQWPPISNLISFFSQSLWQMQTT